MAKRYICVKQKDTKDCACACLATICQVHGLKYPIARIRELAGTDNIGTNILGIVKAAKELNFDARGIRVNNINDLDNNIKLPIIAHVVINNNFLHYVVIHEITDKKVVVADPAKGIVTYTKNDFQQIWSKMFIVLTPNENFKAGNESKNEIKRFSRLLKPQKKIILKIFILSNFVTLFGIIGAFYFKIITDSIIPNNLNTHLNIISLAFIILVIFKVIFEGLRSKLLLYLAQKIDIPLMLGYYNHILDLPLSFFENRKTGELISRFNDASKIREALSGVTITIMIDSFMATVGGIILYKQSKYLFSITIVPLILYTIFVYIFANKIEKSNRMVMESYSDLTSNLVQSINGIETIKSFNAEKDYKDKIENIFLELSNNILNNGKIITNQAIIKNLVKGIFSIILLWIGTIQVMNGNLSFGELLTFNSLIVYFLNPLENIINLQPSLQTALVAAERLGEILDLEIEKNIINNQNLCLKGDIEFKNLNFRYGNKKLLFKNINFKIQQGKKIAFVGSSGSGKTTLAKLIMKFYSYENGEININGNDINKVNLNILREKIAYISQDTFLFSGTILDNLLLGNKNIPIESVVDICNKVGLHEFISKLPLQYGTYIEENGENLSSGQKQRLAIARALLKKPDILIMDEASSNLDSISEYLVEDVIDNLSKDITTIIIAHRLNTVKNCDEIYILENGQIVEKGVHSELIENKQYYYNFWMKQFNDIKVVS